MMIISIHLLLLSIDQQRGFDEVLLQSEKPFLFIDQLIEWSFIECNESEPLTLHLECLLFCL